MNAPVEKYYCYTTMEMVSFSYTWTINNFKLFCDMEKNEITSTTFASQGNDKSRWHLRIQLNGESEMKDYVSLYLYRNDSCTNPVNAKFKLSILNVQKDENKISQSCVRKFTSGKCWGYNTFVKKDYLLNEANGLLPDGKLIIFCQISVVQDVINTSVINTSENDRMQFEIPECQLIDNLGLLYENPKFCDVTLTVREKEFQAHKAILAAHSPVFSAMFEHDMEEKKTKNVDITDIDPEVLRELLRFMYTGKVENFEVAHSLLAAADKYGLKRLKVICEQRLFKSLKFENAAATLVHADLHNAYQLKAKVMDFIITNATDVINTEGFKSMENSQPHLTAEAFRALADQ